MTPHPQACAGVSKSGQHWLDTYPVHLSRSWTLASGKVLLLRPMRHDDGEREETFVRGLSWESGYQRMLGAIKITPEWIERVVALVFAPAGPGLARGGVLGVRRHPHARDAGVREAEGVVLATNRPMLRLAGSVGFSLKADPQNATIVRIRRRLDDADGQFH